MVRPVAGLTARAMADPLSTPPGAPSANSTPSFAVLVHPDQLSSSHQRLLVRLLACSCIQSSLASSPPADLGSLPQQQHQPPPHHHQLEQQRSGSLQLPPPVLQQQQQQQQPGLPYGNDSEGFGQSNHLLGQHYQHPAPAYADLDSGRSAYDQQAQQHQQPGLQYSGASGATPAPDQPGQLQAASQRAQPDWQQQLLQLEQLPPRLDPPPDGAQYAAPCRHSSQAEAQRQLQEAAKLLPVGGAGAAPGSRRASLDAAPQQQLEWNGFRCTWLGWQSVARLG